MTSPIQRGENGAGELLIHLPRSDETGFISYIIC